MFGKKKHYKGIKDGEDRKGGKSVNGEEKGCSVACETRVQQYDDLGLHMYRANQSK